MAYTVQTQNRQEFVAVNGLNTAVKIVCDDNETATFWYESPANAGEAAATRDNVQQLKKDLEDYEAAREAFDNLESYLEGVFGPDDIRDALGPIRATLDELEDTMFGK